MNCPSDAGRSSATTCTKRLMSLIGGWQVNAIATFQRGFPMSITAADVGGLNDTFGTNRADLVGTAKLTKTLNQWFDTSAFKQPAAGFLGTSGRGILRAPGIQQLGYGLVQELRHH